MGGRDEDLPFRIELWDDADRHIEEVIALASDFASAAERMTSREAPTWQAHHVRQKARVMEQVAEEQQLRRLFAGSFGSGAASHMAHLLFAGLLQFGFLLT